MRVTVDCTGGTPVSEVRPLPCAECGVWWRPPAGSEEARRGRATAKPTSCHNARGFRHDKGVTRSVATRCNLRAGAYRLSHNGTGSCTSRTSSMAMSRLTYRHGIPKPQGNCGTRCTSWRLACAGNPASGIIYCPATTRSRGGGVSGAHRSVPRRWATACSSMAVASQHAVKTIVCSQLPWCKKQYCLPARVRGQGRRGRGAATRGRHCARVGPCEAPSALRRSTLWRSGPRRRRSISKVASSMACRSCGASPRACSHSRGPALKSERG